MNKVLPAVIITAVLSLSGCYAIGTPVSVPPPSTAYVAPAPTVYIAPAPAPVYYYQAPAYYYPTPSYVTIGGYWHR